MIDRRRWVLDGAQRNGLRAEQLHFVLVQTFISTELELALAVVEIDVSHRMADVLTPVAYLNPLFERCNSLINSINSINSLISLISLLTLKAALRH